jgi:hypothetical protein
MRNQVTMFRFVILLALVLLAACAIPVQTDKPATRTAIVTSIASGRKSVPAEQVYGLRLPGGRVYFVTQSVKHPLRTGDSVEIEVSQEGTARIRER